MKRVDYIIRDPRGLHVVPMGALCRLLSHFKGRVEISSPAGQADGRNIADVLRLGIRRGEKVSFTLSGDDEAKAASDLDLLLHRVC